MYTRGISQAHHGNNVNNWQFGLSWVDTLTSLTRTLWCLPAALLAPPSYTIVKWSQVSLMSGLQRPRLSSIHTYIHTFIHTYIHSYIHIYIHTSVHTHANSLTTARVMCTWQSQDACALSRQCEPCKHRTFLTASGVAIWGPTLTIAVSWEKALNLHLCKCQVPNHSWVDWWEAEEEKPDGKLPVDRVELELWPHE